VLQPAPLGLEQAVFRIRGRDNLGQDREEFAFFGVRGSLRTINRKETRMTQPHRDILRVQLSNGQTVHAEVAELGGERNVGISIFSFEGVANAIEEISRTITETLKKVEPRKATVEFGVDLALESGNLTALLVKGTGTASLKVTLEWEASQLRKTRV
jgi:hypothetical protein